MVERVMACRRVPGMTVAVVKDDQVWMSKGFGFRKLDGLLPVQEDTKFCIGSLSKAFTSTLFAKLIEESEESGRYGFTWDSRVIDMMPPGFSLRDYTRTTDATIRDLLAHKMGYPPYGGSWLLGLDDQHNRQDYCRRLNQLEHVEDFRTKFAYSNWMYILSACVAERAANNTDFLDVMRRLLWQPLGLNQTVFPAPGTDWEGEGYALPYVWHEDSQQLVALDVQIAENIHPGESSGGICSTPRDMATWMLFLLNDGKHQGQQIVREDILWETFEPSFVANGPTTFIPQFPYTETSPTYAFGWYPGTYRGIRRMQHTGSISAYQSLLTLYPDMSLGIFTNVNGPMYADGQLANVVLHHYITDVVLGLEPWLNESTVCSFPAPWQPQSAYNVNLPEEAFPLLKFKDLKKPIEFPPSGDFEWYEQYTGNFGHLLFGNLTIYYNSADGRLRFEIGRFGTGWLEAVEGNPDIFLVHLDGILWYVFNTGPLRGISPPIRFLNPVNGTYQAVEATVYEPRAPPVFQRDLRWTDLPPSSSSVSVSSVLLLLLLSCLSVLLEYA